MYFTVGCAVEGAHGRKETRFQSVINLPSHLGNLVKLPSIQCQSWQLPLYRQCPPLLGIGWVGMPSLSGNSRRVLYLIYSPWLKMGANGKKRWFSWISHVNNGSLSCTIHSFLGKWRFSFPVQIIPLQKRSSMNQYMAAYFRVIFKIITYCWLRQQNA